MQTGPLWIYDGVAPGQWNLIGIVNRTADKGLAHMHDLNRNGRWEIVWQGSPTWILERPVTSDTADALWRPGRLAVFPNPVHLEAQVAWGNPLQGPRTLAVYDVAGRLVSRRVVTGSPFLWSTGELPSGVYFLRLQGQSGDELATGRAVVNR